MKVSLCWETRLHPLPAAAVVARDIAARDLLRRVLARDDEALSQLTGMAGAGTLVLLGESSQLPWADGAVYLGHDSATPALWFPTTLSPGVPLPLLEKALRARFPTLAPPFALLPQWNMVLPLGAAQTVSRHCLQALLEEQEKVGA